MHDERFDDRLSGLMDDLVADLTELVRQAALAAVREAIARELGAPREEPARATRAPARPARKRRQARKPVRRAASRTVELKPAAPPVRRKRPVTALDPERERRAAPPPAPPAAEHELELVPTVEAPGPRAEAPVVQPLEPPPRPEAPLAEAEAPPVHEPREDEVATA